MLRNVGRRRAAGAARVRSGRDYGVALAQLKPVEREKRAPGK